MRGREGDDKSLVAGWLLRIHRARASASTVKEKFEMIALACVGRSSMFANKSYFRCRSTS